MCVCERVHLCVCVVQVSCNRARAHVCVSVHALVGSHDRNFEFSLLVEARCAQGQGLRRTREAVIITIHGLAHERPWQGRGVLVTHVQNDISFPRDEIT